MNGFASGLSCVAGVAATGASDKLNATMGAMTRKQRFVMPRCPLRPDDPCSLCQPGVTGPQDCGLVYLVMDDPELRELYVADRKKRSQSKEARETSLG